MIEGMKRQTHTRDNNPLQAKINGDRPIELQTAWAMYRPVEALLIDARSQQAPTIRRRTKSRRKRNPALVRIPCRQTKYAAANREGKYTINCKMERPLL